MVVYKNIFLSKVLEHFKRRKLGFHLSFSGPDGAGKTTLITILSNVLSTVKVSDRLEHFLPRGFKNIHQLSVIPKKNALKNQDYTSPYSEKNSSLFSSVLRVCYYGIIFIIVDWKFIRRNKRLNKVILFDRYLTDLIIDPTRARISIDKNIVKNIFSKIARA